MTYLLTTRQFTPENIYALITVSNSLTQTGNLVYIKFNDKQTFPNVLFDNIMEINSKTAIPNMPAYPPNQQAVPNQANAIPVANSAYRQPVQNPAQYDNYRNQTQPSMGQNMMQPQPQMPQASMRPAPMMQQPAMMQQAPSIQQPPILSTPTTPPANVNNPPLFNPAQ